MTLILDLLNGKP